LCLDGNACLITSFHEIYLVIEVDCLASIFADLGVHISAISSESEKVQRPKRNAFVFITTDPESSKVAVEDLRKLEGVKEVYLSHGAYDIIAKVSGESLDHLRESVIKQIKNLSSINSTLTLMLV